MAGLVQRDLEYVWFVGDSIAQFIAGKILDVSSPGVSWACNSNMFEDTQLSFCLDLKNNRCV